MATFHFAGNEMYHALLISKAALPERQTSTGSIERLLRQRAQDYERVTEVTGCQMDGRWNHSGELRT